MATIEVDARFCGPPGSANGGYFAGLLSRHSSTLLRVRLQQPIPLQQPLQLRTGEDGQLEVLHAEQCIARAQPAVLELQVPPAPSYLQALQASQRYIGLKEHFFPHCFVCGPQRARGDGLRIFAGALSAEEPTGPVAAHWVPDASLAGPDGKVRPEFMSAALDCPGYFAARSDAVPMLLGEFCSHIDRCVHVDEPCILVGWRLLVEGRKYQVGTALFDEDGELCARARSLWIEPKGAAGAP